MSVKSPLRRRLLLPFDVCAGCSVVYVLAQIAVASDRLSKQWGALGEGSLVVVQLYPKKRIYNQ